MQRISMNMLMAIRSIGRKKKKKKKKKKKIERKLFFFLKKKKKKGGVGRNPLLAVLIGGRSGPVPILPCKNCCRAKAWVASIGSVSVSLPSTVVYGSGAAYLFRPITLPLEKEYPTGEERLMQGQGVGS